MIPVILVSSRKLDTKKFVESLSQTEKIPKYHIFSFEPETSIITIDQIRDIHKFILKSAFPKIVVVHQFDTAKIESQNAFLKTLEEHSVNTFFVLTCSTSDGFLATIQSRCQIVRLNSQVNVKSKNDFLNFDSKEFALDASARIKKDSFKQELNSVIGTLHSKINEESQNQQSDNLFKYSTLIKKALSIKVMMDEYNIQPEYAFDQLLLDVYSG